MAKSQKSASKSDTNSNKSSDSKVEARPQHQGKDPLAEGNTLVNPTNTEAETHYEVKQTSEEASKIDGQDANERAEQHNAGDGNVDDTPQQVEVPERSEEEEAADAKDRSDALLKTDKTDK